MRILTLHSDFIEIEPKSKSIEQAVDIKKPRLKIKECLVVLSAVQKTDEGSEKTVAKRLVSEVEDIADKVNTNKIVLYPYVHLVSNPSNPDSAKQVLDTAAKSLKKKFKVTQAPFGWNKAMEVKTKGHPLSELSREFSGETKAIEAEKPLKSNWYILDSKGKLTEVSKYNFSKYKNLEKFKNYEISKRRAVDIEPPHIKLMRRLGLVGYEPASDPGNLRFYPAGRLIKALLEDFVDFRMNQYGAMEVETPIMYDSQHPALSSYLKRFPARQYSVRSPDKDLFLRFAACFGQFLMASDATFSYKQLPLRMYELTRYSFRAEQRGELAGLRRLRAFTMPDCHAFCADVDQAKKEMMVRFGIAKKLIKDIGVTKDLEIGIRVTKDFWTKNKSFVVNLVKKWSRPALVEMWGKQFFYFILKYEFNFIDTLGKAAALTTDQIDVNNAENYNINYIDAQGKKKHPVLLHLSPSGAIERVMFALLEQLSAEKNPVFPMWLSPTQIRVCPVSDKFLKAAKKLADQLEHVRVDIDDRKESIGKKVSYAEKEWAPMVIVIGEKEKKAKKLPVRFRETGKIKSMSVVEIIKLVEKETKDKPFRPLPLPRLLSKRPIFA